MKKSSLLLSFALMVSGLTLEAQIKFKLSYDQATTRYTVYIITDSTLVSKPGNSTAGGSQITIKVPSNQFDPVDIVNEQQDMFWESNSRINSPAEAPDFDYINFGDVASISYPEYRAGEPLPLFSFQNAFGCTGQVELVPNDDPVVVALSNSISIGNYIAIFGFGTAANIEIDGCGFTDCSSATDPCQSSTATEEEIALKGVKVYPNPAVDFVNVEINWDGELTEGTLKITDAAGRTLEQKPVTVAKGANQQRLNVTKLVPGNYIVTLEGDDWKLNLDKFTKQ
jgi:hypothetical protein